MSNLDKALLSIGEILANWNPWDEIREGSKAHINEELLTIEIDTGRGHTYQVDLERCSTPAQGLDWIFQVKSKTWATPEIMFDLLTALDVACWIFHGGSLQGCLCPCGTSKKIKWSKDES